MEIHGAVRRHRKVKQSFSAVLLFLKAVVGILNFFFLAVNREFMRLVEGRARAVFGAHRSGYSFKNFARNTAFGKHGFKKSVLIIYAGNIRRIGKLVHIAYNVFAYAVGYGKCLCVLHCVDNIVGLDYLIALFALRRYFENVSVERIILCYNVFYSEKCVRNGRSAEIFCPMRI